MRTIPQAFLGATWAEPAGMAVVAVLALSIAAILAARILHRSVALQYAILLSGLLGCLAVPGIGLLLATTGASIVSLPLLSETSAANPIDVASTDDGRHPEQQDLLPVASPEADGMAVPDGTTRHGVDDPVNAGREPIAWEWGLLLLWLTGTGVLLGFALRSWLAVRSILKTSRPLSGRDPAMRAARSRLGKSLNGDLPLVLVSARVRSPFATGPVIVLPADAIDAIADEELADILVHEAAHILRRDCVVLWGQVAVRCLFWPIPTVHVLNHKLDQAREELCDNWVLAGRDAVSYGGTLLAMAQRACGHCPPAASLGILRRGDLERRISGLLDQQRDKTMKLPPGVFAPIAGLFLLAGVVLCGARVVAQAPPKEPSSPEQAAPAALLKQLLAHDALFDNRSLEIEQRWVEKVSPRGILSSQRHNAIRFGQPDPGLPTDIPDDFDQLHRIRHLLTLRGTDATMENLGDRETIKEPKFVFVNKGRRNSSAGGLQRAWSPAMNDLYLGDAPSRADFFHRELWRLQWPCGFGVARFIDTIDSVRAEGEGWIVKGRMALRTSYSPDDKTRGRDPFELHLDRNLVIRKASIHLGYSRYEIETTGTLKSSAGAPVAESAKLRLFQALPERLTESFEFRVISVSESLTDNQYAQRTRFDPPPETEIRDMRSDRTAPWRTR